MKKKLIKLLVRTRMKLTSRSSAEKLIREETRRYVDLIESFPVEKRLEKVKVPRMLGVDEDMREWSLLEICEHNAIVNRAMLDVVRSLVTKEPMHNVIDPKKDVMPKGENTEKALEDFIQSVDDYLLVTKGYAGLRSTEKKKHPVFGMLDAHCWHVMCGLHLQIHRKQAEVVAKLLKGSA